MSSYFASLMSRRSIDKKCSIKLDMIKYGGSKEDCTYSELFYFSKPE